MMIDKEVELTPGLLVKYDCQAEKSFLGTVWRIEAVGFNATHLERIHKLSEVVIIFSLVNENGRQPAEPLWLSKREEEFRKHHTILEESVKSEAAA